jgi:4-aminobutyrate aminotransferase-like enzyme
MGNVLTLTPPLTITEAQMLQALDILAAAIEDAGTESRRSSS